MLRRSLPGSSARADIAVESGSPQKTALFAVHAVLDVQHSQTRNAEVLLPLVSEDLQRAQAIGENALMRRWQGARRFERYRQEMKFAAVRTAA